MGVSDINDIPESGAVFTLGKSYLSDNHQSYFFIKNDSVKKLICGYNQSAVVCESGRLFVWGENQFGQLGIGSTDIVTKPSCVKTIKSVGYKVRNVAYGQSFGVILTENSKLFYSGKCCFHEKVSFRDKFWNLGNDILVSRKPFEITNEFISTDNLLQDEKGNMLEHFVDIVAGDEHFVVLTGNGGLYGWGGNDSQQLGIGDNRKPIQLNRDGERVRVVRCGQKSTAFITEKNEIFIVGTLNELYFVSLTKINVTSFEELMYSIYLSNKDEIYLVVNSGEIFKSSEKDGNLIFTPHIVINENIRKICTGDGFLSIVTESYKLLTTYQESSSPNNNGRLKSPRELRKFSKLAILDAVSGGNHILVHGIQSSRLQNMLVTSSSSSNEGFSDGGGGGGGSSDGNNNNNNNSINKLNTENDFKSKNLPPLEQQIAAIAEELNDLNRTYIKRKDINDEDTKFNEPIAETKQSVLLPTNTDDTTMTNNTNITNTPGSILAAVASKIPILETRRKSRSDSLVSAKTTPRNSHKNENENLDNKIAQNNNNNDDDEKNVNPIMKSNSLDEFEELEQAVAAAEVNNITVPNLQQTKKPIDSPQNDNGYENLNIIIPKSPELINKNSEENNEEKILNYDSPKSVNTVIEAVTTIENSNLSPVIAQIIKNAQSEDEKEQNNELEMIKNVENKKNQINDLDNVTEDNENENDVIFIDNGKDVTLQTQFSDESFEPLEIIEDICVKKIATPPRPYQPAIIKKPQSPVTPKILPLNNGLPKMPSPPITSPSPHKTPSPKLKEIIINANADTLSLKSLNSTPPPPSSPHEILSPEEMENKLLGEVMDSDKYVKPVTSLEETKEALKELMVEDLVAPKPPIAEIKQQKTKGSKIKRNSNSNLDNTQSSINTNSNLTTPGGMGGQRTSTGGGGDDDGERTTASIQSIQSDRDVGNPFNNIDDEIHELEMKKDEGRVKRFIKDLRDKGRNISCRNSGAVGVADIDEVNNEKNVDQEMVDKNDDWAVEKLENNTDEQTNKTSKICTIL